MLRSNANFDAFSALFLMLVSGILTATSTFAGETNFVSWAKQSLAPMSAMTQGTSWEDLAPVGKMVGNATVVALGEAIHESAEPLEFRNRLFEYLVERKGFTAIAIESGLVEGRIVHDFVANGTGELSEVLADGISWTFDRLPQNRTLIQWLRAYNADPRHIRKLNFYGFDVPGSPGNPSALHGLDTAVREALRYLASVDAMVAESFQRRIKPFLTSFRYDSGSTMGHLGYEKLDLSDRNALTAALDDMVNLLERREADYVSASSPRDYEWGYRAAIGARQVDGWLRLLPGGWNTSSEIWHLQLDKWDARDRAQADNLSWIFDREGPSGKVLVFAHNFHLSTDLMLLTWPSNEYFRKARHQVAGIYLRRRLGKRLLTMGNLIGGGAYGGCDSTSGILEPPPAESIDAIVGALHTPRFLLDLRKAPVGVKNWLNLSRQLGPESSGIVGQFEVGKAFDVLFYLSKVSPACSKSTEAH